MNYKQSLHDRLDNLKKERKVVMNSISNKLNAGESINDEMVKLEAIVKEKESIIDELKTLL